MAKKSGASPLFAGAAIVIGAAASVPKEVWGFITLAGIVSFVVWFAVKTLHGAGSTATANAGADVPESTRSAMSPPDRRDLSSSQSLSDDFATFNLERGVQVREHRVPSAPTVSGKLRWVPIGESFSVAGITISGGMLYVGHGLRDEYEPSLINPNLRVSSEAIDWSIRQTDYWPSYSSITPDARRAYLQWLADGRRAPDANIGYVFLFFYGLERRALHDRDIDASAGNDIAAIKVEVRRLLSIYGTNNSFHRYATQFLSFVETKEAPEKSYLEPPPVVVERGYELPLHLKLGLGQLAVDQRPVPSSWALAWALNDPNVSLRTPVSRCPTEFATLFELQYAEAHGDGFLLKHNRTKLQLSYQPASSAIGGRVFLKSFGDLPDVTAVKSPVQKLQKLVDICTEALDPYSRFIGRNPDKAHALEGLLQLPVELWPATVKAELNDLKRRIGEGMVLMTFGELSGRLKGAGALSRDKVLGLARALESLHVAMEPDVLAGNRTPKAEDKVALFATEVEGEAARALPAYCVAAITLDLACMVAHADGEASPHELVTLTRQINSWGHLSTVHRKRLKAHLRLGIDQPATLAGVKKKLEPLTLDARRAIGRLLAHLTQADGVVSPSEVKFLERVYRALGLDVQLVYSDLHANEPSSPNPLGTTVSKSSTGPQEFSLDLARIAKLEKETAEVSALLAGVFAEELVPEVSEVPLPKTDDVALETTSGILGLDTDHSAFVRLLVTRSSWLRSELFDAASDMELMLDGALEHINEAVMDAFDVPLTDGDDPIEINKEVLETLPV